MRRFLCNTFLAISLLLGDKSHSKPQELGPTEDHTYFEKSIEIDSPPSRELTKIESSRCTYQDEAFHIPTNTCYSAGTQGPCNIYETFFATSEDSDEGDCYCKYITWRWSNVNQPILRSSKDNRCYPVFSQAACTKNEEWFVEHPFIEGFGNCEPNPCINSSTQGLIYVNETLMRLILKNFDPNPDDVELNELPIQPFWFTYRGKCVKTFTLGTCGPPGGNYTMFFRGTDPTPLCVDIESSEYSIEPRWPRISQMESSEGEVLDGPTTGENTEIPDQQKSTENESWVEESLDDKVFDDDTKRQDKNVVKNLTFRSHCNFNGALHIPSKVCYETNGRGPCSHLERWKKISGSNNVGECACFKASFANKFVNQPVSMSAVDNRCYRIFSQGNCLRSYEWFVQHPNKPGFGHCEPNPCRNMTSEGFYFVTATAKLHLLYKWDFSEDLHTTTIQEEPFWFLHKGKCVQTFTKGTCGPPGTNHTMFFAGTKPHPDCSYPACLIENENFFCQPDFIGDYDNDSAALEAKSRTNHCPLGLIKDTNDCSYNATVPVDDSDY